MTEITDLHKPFAQWLDALSLPYVRARSDRESTIALGWPDFTLVSGGKVLLIEFKTDKGKLSTAQKQRIAQIEASGCRVHVIRDMASAIRIVTEWRDAVGQVREAAAPTKAKEFRLGPHVWVGDNNDGWRVARKATAADMGLPTL